MALIIKETLRFYRKAMAEWADQRTVDWPLMGSPVPIAIILGSYMLFVKKLGPALMKNRPPMKLDFIIQAYNLFQVVVCGYLAFCGITDLYGPWGKFKWICEPIDYGTGEFQMFYLKLFYTFFLLKVVDLLDTVFFILRKKERQVTFLHVYHHTIMVAVVWFGLTFIPGGSATYLGAINSFVHCVMYGYYFLANLNKGSTSHLWWKKYVTQLQLFASLTLQGFLYIFTEDCGFPSYPFYVFVPQNLFMTILFWDFYKKQYLTPKKQEA